LEGDSLLPGQGQPFPKLRTPVGSPRVSQLQDPALFFQDLELILQQGSAAADVN
jgi:hypothetical protein